MGGVGDVMMVLVILAGAYILIKSGKLEEILGGDFKLPQLPGLPPLPTPPTRGGTKTVPAPSGGAVKGGEIYPSAAGGKVCINTSDGGLEQGGDRREPQIMCGSNFLNTEATAYVNYRGINDTLSIKLRGPKHGGSTPESDMCNNIHYFGLGKSSPAFGKQAGHTAEYCEFGNSISIPANVWVGAKAIEWNEGSGVHFQSWVENPEGSGWKLVADAVDNGGSGSCSGPASAPYTRSPCAGSQPVSIGFRVDGLKGGGDVQFKNLSVREIAVPGMAKGSAGPGSRTIGGTTAPAPTTGKRTIGSNYASYYSPRRSTLTRS